jgi:hypothetical protein
VAAVGRERREPGVARTPPFHKNITIEQLTNRSIINTCYLSELLNGSKHEKIHANLHDKRFPPMTKAKVSLFSLILLAVAGAAALPASAEGAVPMTVQLTFDRAALAAPDGPVRVLAALEVQATRACAYQRPVSGGRRVDAACVDIALTEAVAIIADRGLTETANRNRVQFAAALPVATAP